MRGALGVHGLGAPRASIDACVLPVRPSRRYLSDNSLSGTIPSEVGLLSNLGHLRLYDNSLSGTIPASICDFEKLSYCNLANNPFACPLPSCGASECGATCK
mmetsp:Transcript_35676/g.93652  ORF Transcript_35676/g.93652 Transcript_35676/m.93652 type:complete len:102 (+) Transcript_35676:375-680(+)